LASAFSLLALQEYDYDVRQCRFAVQRDWLTEFIRGSTASAASTIAN